MTDSFSVGNMSYWIGEKPYTPRPRSPVRALPMVSKEEFAAYLKRIAEQNRPPADWYDMVEERPF